MTLLFLLLASTVSDKPTGLRIDIPSELCIYVPADMRDAKACANVEDTAALVRPSAAPVRIIAQAIEKQDKGTAHTTLIGITLAEANKAAAEDLDSFVSGMARSVAKVNSATAKIRGFDTPGKYDLMRVNGYPVVRYAILLETPNGKATQVCLLIPSENEMLAVVLSSNEVGVPELKPLADALMESVRMPNLNVDDFGKTKAERSAYSTSMLVGVAVGAALALGLALWFVRRRGKQ